MHQSRCRGVRGIVSGYRGAREPRRDPRKCTRVYSLGVTATEVARVQSPREKSYVRDDFARATSRSPSAPTERPADVFVIPVDREADSPVMS